MPNEAPPQAAPESADPSMEEILASIRKILSDDEVTEPPAPPPPPPAPVAPAPIAQAPKPQAEDEVLLLDETMLVDPVEAAPPAIAPEPETEHQAPEPMTPPEPEAPHHEAHAVTPCVPAESIEPPEPTPDLLAPETAAAASSAVEGLVRTLAGRATQVYAGGPTLEDMVRAELRPILKEWMDVNLPMMVERLVRAEIERVVGRGFS